MTDGANGGTRATTCIGRPLAYVVVNPSRPRVTAVVRSLLEGELREAGYAEPVWLKTSISEPGAIQAHLVLAAGTSLMVATGGDGAMRSMTVGLASTGAQIGIVPLGTANLAARSLGMPAGDARTAARVVAYDVDLPADLTWMYTEPWSDPGALPDPTPPGDPRGWTDSAPSTPLTGRAIAASSNSPPTPADPTDSRQLSVETVRAVRTIQEATRRPHQWIRPAFGGEHACMVVAGVRFDAGLVTSTRPALKARVSWGAYALAAMENPGSPRMDLVLSLPDEVGARCMGRLQARNLLVANGGRLPAGIILLPQTCTDDGLLDAAAVDMMAGLAGWSSLARQVLPSYAVHYSESGRSLGRVMPRHGKEVTVQLLAPALVEVDDGLLTPTRNIRVRINPGALLIRRPAAQEPTQPT